MKDKLEKTGHRKFYYRFVDGMRGFGFALLGILLLATPVFIATQVNAAEAYAEPNTSVVETSEEEPSSSTAE